VTLDRQTSNPIQASHYEQLSRKLLQDGEALLSQGDHHQASEKFWGASATMAKAVAEKMGWPHNQHRELYRVVSRLAQETGQPELNRFFVSASALHMNFYEDWFQPEQVEEAIPQVRELVAQLRRIYNG
jgi:hypothetical protein